MFDRYSTASRRAVFLARAEAGFVGSKPIDSEHLLLGLLRVDPPTFQQVAPALSLTSVRADALRWSAPGDKLPTSVDLPISDDGKLAFAQAEALADAHKAAFVRTEHLTLALLSISSSHAAVILEEAGATLARLEQIVAEIQDRSNQEGAPFSSEDLQFLMGS